jgi:ParB-like chromosome segregation protein Spo0J
LIEPSPNPIRKSWDEGKMEELAASIAERGVIVPIKVEPVLFWCDRCQEMFDRPGLRCCPECAHHYFDTQCHNCYRDNSNVPVLRQYLEPYTLGEGTDKTTILRPYRVIYGHRRVEAARRAGLTEIPAIVDEDSDYTDSLIQALIENVQREDMNPIDEAKALRALVDKTGWSTHEIERRGIMKQPQAAHRLLLLDEVPEIQALLAPSQPGPQVNDDHSLGIRHIMEARGAGLDQPDRTAVLFKAARDNLTRHETRAVAEAYKAAETPELKAAVLETSGKLGSAEDIQRVARMKVGVQGMTNHHEEQRRQAFEEYDQAVKDFIDAIRLFDSMIKTAANAARYGKFSPEGARFAVRRIDQLISRLETLKESLGDG